MNLTSRIIPNLGRRKVAAGPPPLAETDAAWRETAVAHDAALAELDELRKMAAAYDDRPGVRNNPSDPFRRELAERVHVANDAFVAAKEVMDAAWHVRQMSWVAEGRAAAAATTARHVKENTEAFELRQKANKAEAERVRNERIELERRLDALKKGNAA